MSEPVERSGAALGFDVGGHQVTMPLEAVVVAGFTGRDGAEVQRHIDELWQAGVRPPATVPAFYLLPPFAVQQAGELVAVHADTSGEVEPVLLVDGAETYVTVGSDHTDRRAEALDIGLSKQTCPKVVARTAWPLAEVSGHWDELGVSSWLGSGGELYQAGRLTSLLRPEALLARIPFTRRPTCFAVLMGTVPVVGKIRGADRFRAALHDPVLERTIEIGYRVRVLDLMETAG